jgi:hypothetical protein
MWTPIHASGTAFTPTVSGKNTLIRGITSGFYAANAIGTAKLTSAPNPYATQSAAGPSPTPSCGPDEPFSLTVVIQ